MGRGKSWSRDEIEAVARAWMHASEQAISSREQNSKQFLSDLYHRFIECAPSDPDALEGRWKSRSQTAVKTQFDAIADDLSKFNTVLSDVTEQTLARGFDISDEKMLRTAVGVHLGTVPGQDSFDIIDSAVSEWKHYDAWRILKSSERFAPANWPTMRHPLPEHEDDDESTDEPYNHVRQSSSIENAGLSYSMPSPTNMHSGGTPMRTLATAALSMNLVGNGLSSMPPLANHSASGDAAHIHENVASNYNNRGTGAPRPYSGFSNMQHGKRRPENDVEGQAPVRKDVKKARVGVSNKSPNALELVGHAVQSLGEALSEYNAITMFSRVDMQGTPEQKAFFEALAEKHVLKAKLDRDKLVKKACRRQDSSSESSSFSR